MSNPFTFKTLKTHLTSVLTLILQIYIYKPALYKIIFIYTYNDENDSLWKNWKLQNKNCKLFCIYFFSYARKQDAIVNAQV